MVREDDLLDDTLRSFVRRLNAGEKPAAILAAAESVQERELAGKLFSIQSGEKPENAVSIATDCLRNLRLTRLNGQLQQLKESAAATNDPASRQDALEEIMKLTGEIARLKQQKPS